MSTYRLLMKDFLAVKKADIEIDDLTVLAGPNASGKSTISRWLVNLVDLLLNYEQRIFLMNYDHLIRFFNILRDLAFDDTQNFGGLGPDLSEYIIDIEKCRFSNSPHPELEHLQEDFEDFLHNIIERLGKIDSQETASSYLEQLINAFNIERDDNLSYEKVELLIAEKFSNLISWIRTTQQSRQIDMLQPLIDRSTYSYEIDQGEMELEEDGTQLIGEQTFSKPKNTPRAIYISTQNIGESLQPYVSTPLGRLLQTQNGCELTEPVRKIITIIRRIIGGHVAENSKNRPHVGRRNKELQFVMRSGKVIPLRRAATGIISLGYLLRLLENGWLTKGTLLVIDEPEGHLHPQWVVEYARILVLLTKTVGVKIMVSSHNPDMVAALQAIAEKEGVLDRTRFYLATEDEEEPDSFVYRNLGQEIGEIFDSFNIAQSRIDLYGC